MCSQFVERGYFISLFLAVININLRDCVNLCFQFCPAVSLHVLTDAAEHKQIRKSKQDWGIKVIHVAFLCCSSRAQQHDDCVDVDLCDTDCHGCITWGGEWTFIISYSRSLYVLVEMWWLLQRYRSLRQQQARLFEQRPGQWRDMCHHLLCLSGLLWYWT